ncbi:fumarylacetoacetate hydrolase family protein [Gordonia sp. CPCC 205515]|uniref:fumarylacetoacetate hydrolase family protein n=1 Tax=Gordonia sp. CPCC 205515 TaxID=3140791 RepID=UPI003AF3F291
MAYATYEFGGRRRVGVVDRSDPDRARLIPLDGLVELGAHTPTKVLTTALRCESEAVSVADVRLCPVVPTPGKIICIGLNYHEHVGETGREMPTYPVMFTKFPSTLIGAHDDIVAPPEAIEIDYEAELALVIGRAGRRIPRDRAAHHILGYSASNDISMRDYQRKTHQWLQGKAWDRSTPLGPYLVTPDEVADLGAARIRTILNGTVLQDAVISQLIFDIPVLIETISEFTTLLPGDVILTGTPGGVGMKRQPPVYLTDGDQISVDIAGIGTVTNTIRREVISDQRLASSVTARK